MFLDFTPGRRISKLPRILQPPALLWRNIWRFRENWRNYRESRRCWNSINSQEIRKHLHLGVEYIVGADVPGEVAEFGTMTGRTAADLARAMAELHCSKRLLLFDSFQGLPAATSAVDRDSPHVRSGVWRPGSCQGISRETLLRLVSRHLPREQVTIYEGWFSETLPRVPLERQLALLHIDSDLYQSARDVLECVFSQARISPGAIVFFDDWNCNRAEPGCGERRAWSEAVARFAVEYSAGGQYGWGGCKFIVHAYQSPPAACPPG